MYTEALTMAPKRVCHYKNRKGLSLRLDIFFYLQQKYFKYFIPFVCSWNAICK